MDHDRFAIQVAEIRTLLEERLGIRARSFDRQVRKAGRLLPRGMRSHARFLVQADELAINPKLWKMIDQKSADRAHAELAAWLTAVNPSEQRTTRIINLLAVIAFNLLLLGGLLVGFLWWQGLV